MIETLHLPFPVWYCRHGETDWNKANRLQGHADIPLNETGREQARGYGRALATLDVDWAAIPCFVSPLSRAQETLDIILTEIKTEPESRTIDDRLIELNLGKWCGMAIEDIRRHYARDWLVRQSRRWDAPVPEGESYADAEPRLRAFAEERLSGPALVVGHGGTGRILRGMLTHGNPRKFLSKPTFQDRVYVLESGKERTIEAR